MKTIDARWKVGMVTREIKNNKDKGRWNDECREGCVQRKEVKGREEPQTHTTQARP